MKPLPLQIYIYVDSFGKELPEHRQQTAIETWLHSSPDEIGFNLLKEDVQRALARDASIVLKSGETAHVTWQGETIVIQNGRKISVEEGQFCELWSYMRDSGVFAEQALPEKYAEFAHPAIAILKKLDYLQDVVLSDNGIDFDSGSNGYQYAKM